ncbi:MAG TPA: hypothetical protein VLV45_12725 [Gemmatimonadales bacterium]|nr:hypothetical protein [Gemmatimonadales bacterium]
MQIRLHWPPHDSAEVAIRAAAYPCRGAVGRLLTGAEGGNGILIWVRNRGGAAGDYPILARGDSTTPRGATVSVRFMVGEIARGFGLDSGLVQITTAGSRLNATLRGSGIDYSVGQRVSLVGSVAALPSSSDSVSCKVQL